MFPGHSYVLRGRMWLPFTILAVPQTVPACCPARWAASTSWIKLLINCQVASSSIGRAGHVAGMWAVLVGAAVLPSTGGGVGCGASWVLVVLLYVMAM